MLVFTPRQRIKPQELKVIHQTLGQTKKLSLIPNKCGGNDDDDNDDAVIIMILIGAVVLETPDLDP
jgi:hypothetical protein